MGFFSSTKNKGNVWVWILVIGAIISFSVFGDNKKDSDYNSNSQFRGSYIAEDERIDYYDAISYHWDEIKEYVDGSETIEACSSESGNCYDLDAEISSGQIEMIYFPSGGYLYFSADIDENGSASDYDQEGNSWDFSFDMDSSLVDDAVNDWASDNNFELEY